MHAALDARVRSSSSHEWLYLSEGKASVVFAFVGDRSASGGEEPLAGLVLKANKDILRRAADPNTNASDLVRHLRRAQRYVRGVMRPLLDAASSGVSWASAAPAAPAAEWIDAGRIVWVDAQLLDTLLMRDASLRPASRIRQFGTSEVAAAASRRLMLPVLLFEDYTSPLHLHHRYRTTAEPILTAAHAAVNSVAPMASRPVAASVPTVCIELKPKWGFLPRHDADPDHPHTTPLHPVKLDTCRYCMHQYLKLEKGEVVALSAFCPLDLYSCSRARVHHAFGHLLRAPQNNLRIFVRGGDDGGSTTGTTTTAGEHAQMINLTDHSHLSRLARILFPSMSAAACEGESAFELIQGFLASLVSAPASPFRAVFARLALLQRALDRHDIERLATSIACLLDEYPEAASDERLWTELDPISDDDSDESSPSWLATIIASLRLPAPVATSEESTAEASPPLPPPSPAIFEYSSRSVLDCARTPEDAPVADAVTTADQSFFPLCAHRTRVLSPPHPLPPAAVTPVSPVSPASPSPSCLDASSCPHWHACACRCSLVRDVRAFLLATTLKDVSLMCTVQASAADADNATNTTTRGPAIDETPATSATSDDGGSDTAVLSRAHYSVRLIDLECKSSSKLREYVRLDRAILQHYLQCHAPKPKEVQA